MMIKAFKTTDSELEVFWKYSEPQLLHYYEPAEGVFIAESPNVIGRALGAGYVPEKVLMEIIKRARPYAQIDEKIPEVIEENSNWVKGLGRMM